MDDTMGDGRYIGRAMVLGTNAGQADLIRYFKKMGWFVLGCAGSVGEPGQKLCDVFEHLDIRDIDALEPLVRQHQIDLVYSVSSDIGMKSAVKLAERTNLPHFFDSEFINLLDNKADLREFLRRHDLNPVRYQKITDIKNAKEWSQFPCVVKPADAQGQRGVQKVSSSQQLIDATEAAIESSPTDTAIIEDFLDGVEMSCNVVLADGKAIIKILSERLVHDLDQIGLPKGHLVPPVAVSKEDQRLAMNLVDDVLSALDQSDGVLYFQMIHTFEGPRIVEIAPRLDGCHMWRIILAATGVNLIDLAVRALQGERLVDFAEIISVRRTYELMFQQMAPDGRFEPEDFPEPSGSIYHEHRYEPGEVVRPINGKLEVVGYYVRETP